MACSVYRFMRACWSGMRAEEAQKRYSNTIETAIGKAKLSRERVAIKAQDGAEVYVPIRIRAASPGASTRLART